MSTNGVIGKDNGLPWRLPKDMKHFMSSTMGKPVIMGRKTFESMKSPLPGRTNIVLTRDQSWSRDGVFVASDLSKACELGRIAAEQDSLTEFFIIGGSSPLRRGDASCDSALRYTNRSCDRGRCFFSGYQLGGLV